MRLRVGYNLLWLLPERAGGAEEYAIRVLRSLVEHARDVDVTVFGNRRLPRAHPDLAASVRTVVAPFGGSSRVARIASESSWLLRATARADLDLVHHVNDVMPLVRNRPGVLTIHDLRAFDRPQTLSCVQAAYLRARMGPSALAARVVTTPSEYSRARIVERFGVDPGRVLVVPAPLSARSGDGSDGVRIVEAPFFLYPAITGEHKNHVTLLRAFARVVERRPDAALVLTGAPGPAEADVRHETERLGIGPSVRRLGRVRAADLDGLLRTAVALVYPSRYEGYGLPLAEAMALGCPVIASNATALPEVVDGAGSLLDPDDVDGWAREMTRYLEDDAVRTATIAAGRTIVRSLTPHETARRMAQAYGMAVGDG